MRLPCSNAEEGGRVDHPSFQPLHSLPLRIDLHQRRHDQQRRSPQKVRSLQPEELRSQGNRVLQVLNNQLLLEFNRQGASAQIRRSARQRLKQQHPRGLQRKGQSLGLGRSHHRAPGRIRPPELQRLGAPQLKPNLRLRGLQLGDLKLELKAELRHLTYLSLHSDSSKEENEFVIKYVNNKNPPFA